MSKFTLNHLALSVKDVDQSVDFYQKIFQLKEIPNTASNSKTRWLEFSGGKQIHLIPRPNLEVKTNKALHFALSTSDIESFVAHLGKLQIQFWDWLETPNKIHIRKDGIKQIYFQDPNGYWIEVNNDN